MVSGISVTGVVHSLDELDITRICADAKVAAFDLDNTLARSKKPMSADMASVLTSLTRLIPVAIVTGGRFQLVESQVLAMLGQEADRANMHLMPTSGTRCYRWDGEQWRCQYAYDLSETDRKAAIESLERHAKEQGMWGEHAWGPRIEDRGSQITFSALGQEAPLDVKEHWDPDNSRKNRLAAAVAADLPNLAVHSGGSTSVDISDRGIDKAFAVRKLADMMGIEVPQIIFIGDRMDPDGNDYPAAMAGTMSIRVANPDETIRVCERMIATLRKA